MLNVYIQTDKKRVLNNWCLKVFFAAEKQKATCVLFCCVHANVFGTSASAGKHGLFCLHLSPPRIPRCEIWARKDSRANRPFKGQTAITPVNPCDVLIHGCRPPPPSTQSLQICAAAGLLQSMFNEH